MTVVILLLPYAYVLLFTGATTSSCLMSIGKQRFWCITATTCTGVLIGDTNFLRILSSLLFCHLHLIFFNYCFISPLVSSIIISIWLLYVACFAYLRSSSKIWGSPIGPSRQDCLMFVFILINVNSRERKTHYKSDETIHCNFSCIYNFTVIHTMPLITSSESKT